jgi:hypothetical protein
MKKLTAADKNIILEVVSNKLNLIAYDDATKLRDDLWQENFISLLQAKYNLRCETYSDELQLLKEHLMLLVEIYLRKIDKHQEINAFFDIKITVNDVEYEIPLDCDVYNTLVDFIDKKLGIEDDSE